MTQIIVQISDTHFGTERPQVTEALVGFIHAQKPELVVLSGDITQRARVSEFAAARRFVDRLQTRVLAIPGNHDIPLFNPLARLFFAYQNYSRCFGEDLEPTHDSGSLLVQCLNTTRPSRHKDGEVSAEQIERVAARLRAARADQLRVVVTHQPVHVIRKSDITNLLHGHREAVHAWAEAGADVILGGHIHLPYVRPLSECFADLPRRVWAIQAGTAVSHRVRDGVSNSVNVLRYDPTLPKECKMERWDHNARSGEFERITAETLGLDR